MTVQQIAIPIGQDDIAAGTTARIELPNAHYLGAIDIHFAGVVTTSAGGITVVDTTLGMIGLIERIQLRLDGKTSPLQITGRNLDYWSHVDRPGMERLALSGTTSPAAFDTVLRYELAQSEANLTGALKLSDYKSVVLEIKFSAITDIATGTDVAISGNVDVYGEMYDENAPGVLVNTSLVHTLNEYDVVIDATGNKKIKLQTGRALERLLIIAENNGSPTWDLISNISLEGGPGDIPYDWATPIFRARQLRHYGGDDTPIVGMFVLDLRRAGNRDIIPLGDGLAAPAPQIVVTVPAGTALTNAKLTIIPEELESVRRIPAAA